METIRRVSKKYYLRQMVVWLLVNVMFFGLPFGALAGIGDGGWTIQGGNADIIAPGGNANATIDLLTPAAVIGWKNFNTVEGQSVTFDRNGGMNFAVLNRISGGATSFMGNLYGNNGLVIVSNPAGIIFGPRSFVQARSFAAVGFDIAPAAFMAKGIDFDPLRFEYSGPGGDITLESLCGWRATMEVDETLALIGKNIYNKGRICVKDPDNYSYVVMAAGDSVKISRKNSHVNVDVTASDDNYELWNGGELLTGDADGEVSLVLAAGDIYSTAISGVESLRATAVFDAKFCGDIDVYADADSDAVAEVDIATGGDLTIDHDIRAVAVGDGESDAISSISLTSDGDITVTDSWNPYFGYQDTEVRATAENGHNNTATVTITAQGDVDVTAANADVKVVAEAYNVIELETPDEGQDIVLDDLVNTATVDITGKSVEVRGEYGNTASVEALAHNEITATALNNSVEEPLVITAENIKNDADVVITTTADGDDDAEEGIADNGDVLVIGVGAERVCKDYVRGEAYVSAEAWNDVTADGSDWPACGWEAGDTFLNLDVQGLVENNAEVLIDAKDDVMTIAAVGGLGGYAGNAGIGAEAYNSFGADADKSLQSQAELTITGDGTLDNYAGVDVTAGDDVIVKGGRGYVCPYGQGLAAISAETYNDIWTTDNPAYAGQVNIEEFEGPGNNTSEIAADAGGDVLVHGIGGDGYIEALAYNGTDNLANVSIDAEGDVEVMASGCEAAITANAYEAHGYGDDPGTNNASVALGGPGHKIGGDVKVIAEHGNASIESDTHNGDENTSDVLICTEGHLKVQAGELCGMPSCGDKNAHIKAQAYIGGENTSSVGIGAEDGICVLASGDHSNAAIESESMCGYENKADVIACTDGDLWVMALNGGDAEIASEALFGYISEAYTGVCATGDIIVTAADFGGVGPQAYAQGDGFGGGEGTSAKISSAAWSLGCDEGSSASADTHVVSKEGGVIVAAMGGCGPRAEAGVTSMAVGGAFNHAYTGVAAAADLSPLSLPDLGEIGQESIGLMDFSDLLTGNVFVGALGNAKAEISSVAGGCEALENDAMTVVCAPGKVVVAADFGGEARISSMACGPGDNEAQTKVYAGGGELGSDIVVMGNASISAMTPGNYMCITEEGQVAETDGSALVVIDNYANRDDCPDCPACPCEEEDNPIPPAPLSREAGEPLEPQEFEPGGCPALMQWFANEVGLPLDQIHVLLSNADYLSTDVQPCDACARLKQQSKAMAMDTAAVDAWASTVRTGLVGPITPEMMDGIRTALADNPAAIGFDEAAAEYVKILSDELGFERDDAVAVVTGKYAPDAGDLGAYINARAGM